MKTHVIVYSLVGGRLSFGLKSFGTFAIGFFFLISEEEVFFVCIPFIVGLALWLDLSFVGLLGLLFNSVASIVFSVTSLAGSSRIS